MPPAVATPISNKSTPSKVATPVKDSPGNWQHPRLAEITRRQSRNVFSEKNAKAVLFNVGALILVVILRSVAWKNTPAGLITPELKYYLQWGYTITFLVPIFNIGLALMPFFMPKDDLSDIPLTPAQRRLLGLPASAKPDVPGSVYSTPPRYSRTPSAAGSPASNRSYPSSPLSAKGSPMSEKRLSGSPVGGNSPLLQKAVTSGINGARRSSIGSPSPLGMSTGANLFGNGPGTPTPASGKRSSVGLNNKWLYEKGRRSSSNSWLHQGL